MKGNNKDMTELSETPNLSGKCLQQSPGEDCRTTGRKRIPFFGVCLPALAVIAGAVLLAGGCFSGSNDAKVETRSWTAMGTIVGVSLCDKDPDRKEALFRQIVQRVRLLEDIMSAHKETSELSRLNRLGQGERMSVSRELWDALSAGKKWNAKTFGAFDMTVAPLIGLWKTAGKVQKVPGEGEIRAVLDQLGVDRLVLNEQDQTIMKTDVVSVDLGGLGKGFTADDIVRLLQEQGATSALVTMSGDIRAFGRGPKGRPWRVGIQDPRSPDDAGALVTVVELSDMAVSTSGNYRRFVEINGKHYSHIVDPRSGRTAENVPSVSVIGPDTLTTDIMGTALSVLGVGEGMKLVESMQGVEALFMVVDDAGELILTRSSGFAKYEDSSGVKDDITK